MEAIPASWNGLEMDVITPLIEFLPMRLTIVVDKQRGRIPRLLTIQRKGQICTSDALIGSSFSSQFNSISSATSPSLLIALWV
jgi:hypothetical protein